MRRRDARHILVYAPPTQSSPSTRSSHSTSDHTRSSEQTLGEYMPVPSIPESLSRESTSQSHNEKKSSGNHPTRRTFHTSGNSGSMSTESEAYHSIHRTALVHSPSTLSITDAFK